MGLISASRWRTIYDLDFSAAANHTFSPNGGVGVDSNGAGPGGFTWYSFGSGGYAASTAIVNGSGLIVQPGSTTDYNGATRTFCGIFLPLSFILPVSEYDPSMGIRLWAYASAQNSAANYDNSVIAIDCADASGFQYVQKRGHGTAGVGLASYFGNAGSNVSGFLSDGVGMANSNDVQVIETPSLGDAVYSSYFGQYSAGWPAIKDLTPCFGYKDGATAGYGRGGIKTGIVSGIGFSLGAQRAGSGTSFSVTFARMRVDVRT